MKRSDYIAGKVEQFRWTPTSSGDILSCRPDNLTELRVVKDEPDGWTLTGWYKHHHVVLEQGKYRSKEDAQQAAKIFFHRELGYYRKKYYEED